MKGCERQMKSSNVGGQAVMEGVMMRNGDKYAVAVRTQDQKIEIMTDDCKGIFKNKKLTKLPIIRGVLNFVDSLVLGMKTLSFSASFFEEEEDERDTGKREKKELTVEQKENQEKVFMGLTAAFSVVLAVGIFMLLPNLIAGLLRNITDSNAVIAVTEGVLRIAIFMCYLIMISQMKDIQRVFMYHGAEHKCINCIENGLTLNVENVMKCSKQHKRCGTSFIFYVLIISIIVFTFIRVDTLLLRVGLRILLTPVIAGISYEMIKLAGRSEHKIVTLISKPGMLLQNLTTREPEPDMAEVAIASVEAVFDWKEYQRINFGKEFELNKEDVQA